MLNHAVEKGARIRIRLRAPDLPGLYNTSSYRGVTDIRLEDYAKPYITTFLSS